MGRAGHGDRAPGKGAPAADDVACSSLSVATVADGTGVALSSSSSSFCSASFPVSPAPLLRYRRTGEGEGAGGGADNVVLLLAAVDAKGMLVFVATSGEPSSSADLVLCIPLRPRRNTGTVLEVLFTVSVDIFFSVCVCECVFVSAILA